MDSLIKSEDFVPGSSDVVEGKRNNSDLKECRFCDYIGSCRRDVRKHKKLQHKDQLKVFHCNECSYTTHWGDSMKLHKKFHNSPLEFPSVKCSHCDYLYRYNPHDPKGSRRAKQLLNGHMNDEHAQAKLKCDQCYKTFWTAKQLLNHKANHNYLTVDGNYSCDQCDYKCKKTNRLRFHIDSVHLGVKPHLCDVCPAAFPTKGALNVHKLSHSGERNFKCIFCEKAFHSKQNLITHVRTHTGEKPYTCDVCGKSFSDQAYFATHKRLHITDNSGQRIKAFVCEICSKGFTRRTYLKYHMTSHQTEADGKSTKYSNEFKMSAVARTKDIGLSKAADELCINLNTLKGWVQLSVHPHICEICEKAFPYKASLKKHLLTHPEYKAMNGLTAPGGEEAKPNIRYEPSFKQEVAQFALANSIQEATAKYQLAHSTVNYWLKLISDPKPCHLCGKSFANDSTVRRHIEQVHKNTPEGAIEQARKTQELSVQPFFQYLADNDLLPSEDMIKAREDEREKRDREKLDLAAVAREVMAREQEKSELQKEVENMIKQEEEVSSEDYHESHEQQMKEAIKLSLKFSFQKDAKEWKLKKDDPENDNELSNDGFNDGEETSEEGDVEKETYQSSSIKLEGLDNYDSSIFEPDTCLEMTDTEEPKSEEDDTVKLEPIGEDQYLEPKHDSTGEKKAAKRKIKKKTGRKNMKHQKNMDGSYSCSFCYKTFFSTQRARYHEKVIHIGEFVTNCEYCGTQFKEGIKLNEHQLRKHPELLEEKLGEPITRYQCDLCEKCFNVKRDFDRHVKTTHGPKKVPDYKFICDHCGKRFSRRTYLRTHENRIHGIGEVKVRQFQCPHCQNIYSVKDHLNRHIRVIHENERLQCDLCAKLFCDKSGLNRHQLYHGEPQFECLVCNDMFREGRYLKRHKRLVHEGVERPHHTCAICLKDFRSDQSYKNHIQMFHEESDSIMICNICGKEFKNVKLHKVHMRFHELKKKNLKFTCETCGHEYKSNVSLQAHINTIHMGLRNFDCDICGKLFTRANTLRTHKKIHSGLKPFQCLYCNSGYGEKRNLMNHIGRNHPGSELKFKKETTEGSVILDC